MPRAPAFKIAAIEDLLRQIAYAPAETRHRQMDAAERLANEIDADQAYPSEFVIFRITGYRPEGDEILAFSGAALRRDLINFVQRLSDALDLPPMRNQQPALTLEELAQRLNVSAKTIQRYRREGLICHVVQFDDGRKQLACYQDALERFAAGRQDHLERAAQFTRISHETESLIIDEAQRLRAAKPLTLNTAARMIARKHSRAHETIRQILQRHDRAADQPIFHGRGPLTQREMHIMHRAWIRGVDLAPMAERFGRSRPSIHRAITARRAALLRPLEIPFIEMPTFQLEGAESVILSAPAASRDLLALPPHDDAVRLLEWASDAESPDESTEDALLGAWNFLKRRAARNIAQLAQEERAGSDQIDAIETDLRWATHLHRRLTMLALPSALKRIEANLDRHLVTMSAEQIVMYIRMAAGVIREALEVVDPSREQRLERVTAFAMERDLAQRSDVTGPHTKRAAARHAAGTVLLHGVFDDLDEWERWLDPWRGWRWRLNALNEESRSLVAWRLGWDGAPPHTLQAIGQRLRTRQTAVARRLQKAIRELRTAGRESN